MRNQLSFLYDVLRDFVEPLRLSLESLEALEYLFYRYGWQVKLDEGVFAAIQNQAAINQALSHFLDESAKLDVVMSEGGDEVKSAERIAAVAQSAQALFQTAANFGMADLSVLPAPLNQENFWSDVGNHLLDDLLEAYVRVYYPNGYVVLHLFGIIRYEPRHPTESHRRPYTRIIVDWNQAGAVVRNPLRAFQDTYHWNDTEDAFQHQRLLTAVREVLRAVRVSARLMSADPQSVARVAGESDVAIKADADGLRVRLLYRLSESTLATYEIGLDVYPAVIGDQVQASGLVVRPVVRGGINADVVLGRDVRLRAKVEGGTGELMSAAIFPDKILSIGGAAQVRGQLILSSRTAATRHLLGNSDTARIEASGWTIRIGVEGLADDVNLSVQIAAGAPGGPAGCKLVIPLDEADGFVKETLNRPALEMAFPLEVSWSSRHGLRFNGGEGLDFALPGNVRLGPVSLYDPRMTVSEGPKDADHPSVELGMRTGLRGDIGPIQFSVQGIGLRCQGTVYDSADLATLPDDRSPLFGRLGLRLEFAAPNGIGLEINGGGFKGGGFLSFESDTGRYAGMLELEFEDQLVLKATGLLSTRLPDGRPGYSLLIVISSEFKPIQLGYGFSLVGVGGLIGIHRSVNVDVLRAGLKSRRLDSILFPKDPLRNASQIISNLRAVFPPTRGHHVFGPMAAIVWGTPTVMRINLGLVLEFDGDSPVRLLVLGQFNVSLPSQRQALVRMHMDALGQLDFDTGKVSVDAVLYDSRVLNFVLTGDMALRANFVNQPSFVLACGGFHPRFTPPEAFPRLDRLAISLSQRKNPRLRLEAYLAQTSNTCQIGARLDLYIAVSSFSIEGYLSFDALFEFLPFFQFVADFAAGVTLKWKGRTLMGVLLNMTLSGPSTWRARGKATFKVWIFSKSVSFDRTIGPSRRPPSVPRAKPLPELLAALRDVRNWSGQLAGPGQTIVALRDAREGEQVLVHPLADISVRQRVLPLGIAITKFGNTAASGERFAISSVQIGVQSVGEGAGEPHAVRARFETVKDFFAPGQFVELSEDESLTSPSFELMESGFRLHAEGVAYGGQDDAALMTSAAVEYEQLVIDADGNSAVSDGHRVSEPAPLLVAHASLGAVARAANRAGLHRATASADSVELGQSEFVIVSTDDLSIRSKVGPHEAARGTSHARAMQILREHLDQHEEERGRLQVVARHHIEEHVP